MPDCCSAGYTLLQGFFQGSLHLVHGTHDHHKSGCQWSMLHKCFPQLCYCCYLNDSMSLFFVLSDSATFLGYKAAKNSKQLNEWEEEHQQECERSERYRSMIMRPTNKIKHKQKSGSNKEKKTRQNSVAVRCSRMFASLFRIHGSRPKCILQSSSTAQWREEMVNIRILATPKKKRGSNSPYLHNRFEPSYIINWLIIFLKIRTKKRPIKNK